MHDGFNRIFWGMCFVTFHITIFGFEGLPLPAFIAYLMVWSGIKQLIDEPQPTVLKEAYAGQGQSDAAAVTEKPLNQAPDKLSYPSRDPNLDLSPESQSEHDLNPNYYFKRAGTAALISALIAVPRVLPAYFNQLLAQNPLAELLNFGLISLLDLALAYFLFTGAACLLEIQGKPDRKVFYLKRLRAYLLLLSGLSVTSIAVLALGKLEFSVVISIAMLILRIWFIMLIHGLKPAPVGEPSGLPSAQE